MEKTKKVIQKKKKTPVWNKQFQLRGGSCSLSDIQDYFKYIIKNYEAVTDNPSIRTYLNQIEKRITFRIKAGYYLELLTPKTMKLFGRTKSEINKDENDENVPHLEITEVVLDHCNIVNNNCQSNSRALYTFVSNKSFSQLLDI